MKKSDFFAAICFLIAILGSAANPNPAVIAGNAADRCAADDAVVRYRTGKIDPLIAAIPEEVLKSVRAGQESGVRELAAFFRKSTPDDFRLVKIIHDWISTTICYDFSLLFGLPGGGSRKPLEFLKTGRTTCGGFCDLFVSIAGYAGLEAIRIDGLVKTYYFTKGKVAGDHAWNAVRLNAKWHLVDTTYDATGSYLNGKFEVTGEYLDRHLFVNPEFYIHLNYPKNRDQQFLSKPLDYGEYAALPLVNYWFYRYGLEFAPPTQATLLRRFRERLNSQGQAMAMYECVELEGGKVSLAMSAPEGVMIIARLVGADKKNRPDNAYGYYENGFFHAEFSAPAAGEYAARILAKREGEKDYRLVYSFEVHEKRGRGPDLPEPGRIYRQFNAEKFDLKVVSDNLASTMNGGIHEIKVDFPGTFRLVPQIRNKENVVVPWHSALDRDGSAYTLYFSSPGKGEYFGRIYLDPAKGPWVLSREFMLPAVGEEGPLLPAPGRLYRMDGISTHGVVVNRHNLDSAEKDGYYLIDFSYPPGVDTFFRLADGKANHHGRYQISYYPGRRIYIITPPTDGVYIAELAAATSGKFDRTPAFSFRVDGNIKPGTVPPPRTLMLDPFFEQGGYRLISEDVSDSGKSACQLRIEAPDDIPLACLITDARGKEVKNHGSRSVSGRINSFSFKIPAAPGRYTAVVHLNSPKGRKYPLLSFVMEGKQP